MFQNWNSIPYNFWYYPNFDYQSTLLTNIYPTDFLKNQNQKIFLKREEVQPQQNFDQRVQKQVDNSHFHARINVRKEKDQKNQKNYVTKYKGQKSSNDHDYQERRQTPQRNTLSNTIKYFLRYVILKPFDALIQINKITSQTGINYDAGKFLNSFQKQFQSKMNYISKDSIQNIWTHSQKCLLYIQGDEKINFCSIFRKLFIRYFEKIIFEERLTDKKKKKKYQSNQKKFIKSFIRQLENKYLKLTQRIKGSK